MTFGEIKIGEIFFEGSTGEYHKKVLDTSSIIIDRTGKTYYTCEFPSDHEVEEADGEFQ